MKKEILLAIAILLFAVNGFGARIHEPWTGNNLPRQWTISRPEALADADDRLLLTGNNTLAGWMQFEPALPQDYAFQVEIQPVADHWRGYAFTVSAQPESMEHPLWYIEFIGNRIALWGMLEGAWRHFGVTDPLDGWFDTPFKLTVRNNNDTVDIKVEHDSNVVLEQKIQHDITAENTFLKFNCSCAEDMTVGLQNWTFGGELPGDADRFPAAPKQSAGQISSPEITAELDSNGKFFLFRPGTTSAFACFSPVMEALPDFERLPMTLISNTISGNKIEQCWQAGDFELRLSAVPGDGPWLKVSTSVANLSDQAGRVRVIFQATPTAYAGDMTDLISFRKDRLKCILPLDEKLDPLSSGLEWTWGTSAFSYPEEMLRGHEIYIKDLVTGAMVPASRSSIDSYVPLVATYNAKGGIVMTGNPRSSFLFRAGSDGISAGHIYYLPAEKGFIDSGFFDGTGEATYDLYLGYPVKNDWGALWRDYYCRQNEWLRSGPKCQPLVTAEDTPDDGPYGEMIRRTGVNNIGTYVFNMFSKEEELVKAMEERNGIERVQQMGCLVTLWTNIFMAPDLDGNGKHWDPALDYRNFQDAWIVGSNDRPYGIWDGYLLSPSPRFSFGQFEYNRLTSWVEKYNFDGIFLDLYEYGSDVDWTHTYEHLPFFPIHIAVAEYCQMLSDWCVANQKTLILNCPPPPLMVWHLAGSYQGDTPGIRGDITMMEKLATAAAGRPHTLLGVIEDGKDSGQWLKEDIGAIFYGEIPSPWRLLRWLPKKDLEPITRLFERNYRIINLVGTAEIMGGDLTQALWFAAPAGEAGYVTMRNQTKYVETRRIRLAERVTLAPGQYKALLWDLTGPATILAEGDETLAEQEFELLLAPDEVKVLCFVPEQLAGELQADSLGK